MDYINEFLFNCQRHRYREICRYKCGDIIHWILDSNGHYNYIRGAKQCFLILMMIISLCREPIPLGDTREGSLRQPRKYSDFFFTLLH